MYQSICKLVYIIEIKYRKLQRSNTYSKTNLPFLLFWVYDRV